MDNPQRYERYEELRRDGLGRAVGDFFRWRLSAAPLSVTVAVALALLDHALWRRLTMVGAVVIMTMIAAVQYARDRRGSRGDRDIAWNLVAIAVVQLVVIAVTGGLDSPLFPAVFVITLLMTTFLRGAALAATVGFQLAAIAGLTVLGALGLSPPVPLVKEAAVAAPGATIARGTVALVILLGAVKVGQRARAAFEEIARSAIRARDEALSSYAEETRTVTTMAGEIAHELKNPLATVKGLAQLVARDLEGKPAERAAVLRREVDRMADILDDFLNFSRPLTPLAQGEIDLAEICRDVALLHEGAARERGVRVSAEGEGRVTARCDARKIKQILVNLITNAVAATPAGGAVRVGARGAGSDRVEVTVSDEGPGLSAEIAAHAFEPGVTTKPGGSGLGLTVSRGLARQHGGDLRLASSPAGCVATLDLPRAGAAS